MVVRHPESPGEGDTGYLITFIFPVTQSIKNEAAMGQTNFKFVPFLLSGGDERQLQCPLGSPLASWHTVASRASSNYLSKGYDATRHANSRNGAGQKLISDFLVLFDRQI
jgi:hypothetical protein